MGPFHAGIKDDDDAIDSGIIIIASLVASMADGTSSGQLALILPPYAHANHHISHLYSIHAYIETRKK